MLGARPSWSRSRRARRPPASTPGTRRPARSLPLPRARGRRARPAPRRARLARRRAARPAGDGRRRPTRSSASTTSGRSAGARRAPTPGEPIVRRVLDAAGRGRRGTPGGLGRGRRLLRFDITATSFCHQMVRSLVATLVAVGPGRAAPRTSLAARAPGTARAARRRRRPRASASWRSATAEPA